jgi:PmbA protein
MKDVNELKGIVEDVLGRATKAGADGAEVFVRNGREFECTVRQSDVEVLKDAGYRSLSLRVLQGGRAVATGSSDLSSEGLDRLVKESMDLVGLTDPDDSNVLPDPALLAKETLDLDLYDQAAADRPTEEKLEAARTAEKVAMGSDERITASGGASYGSMIDTVAFGTSAGFIGGWRGTYDALSVEVIADDEGGKKRNGWWYTQSRFLDGLQSPETVGEVAARRAVERLGARKVPTQRAAIIFDPIPGAMILRDLFTVLNGTSWYKRRSYLAGKLGETVANSAVTVVDDPLIKRGPGSRPFDGEGLPTRRNVLVDKGVLKTVLTSTYSARKADLEPTGSASGGGATPGETPSNLYMEAGDISRDDLIKGVGKGLLVTDLMGFGFNPVTGDFSRGCGGFWVEDGQIVHPVAEVTISASFPEVLGGISRIADDLTHERSVTSPTFLVDGMTIAGT